jgi:hypothetical protein
MVPIPQGPEMTRARMGVAATLIAAAVTFLSPVPVSAHERRAVGNFKFVVGWIVEPPYTGVLNGVQVFLSDATGKPITDLGQTLRVQVVFQGIKSKPLPLEAAFNATSGRAGEYDATMFPTRPGIYTFHLTGTVHGQAMDESFTSSDHTFADARNASDRDFPVKDPSAGDLGSKLVAANSQAAAAKHKAAGAATLATIGIFVGALGLMAGALGLVSALTTRRRSRR